MSLVLGARGTVPSTIKYEFSYRCAPIHEHLQSAEHMGCFTGKSITNQAVESPVVQYI